MITDYEKNIYNIFLVVSRKVKNKPVRHRQDFTKLQPNTYCALKKVAALLQRNKNITPREFFAAPYEYYGVEEYFSLDFYTTVKAIKCYTLYVEQQERNDPDNIDVIERCKECCKYIYSFCKQNNLTLAEYKLLINGTTPIILQHLKDHKINFYTVHGLNCESVFKGVEVDLLNFFIKDFNNLLAETRLKFQRSTTLKVTLRKALNIIEVELLKK